MDLKLSVFFFASLLMTVSLAGNGADEKSIDKIAGKSTSSPKSTKGTQTSTHIPPSSSVNSTNCSSAECKGQEKSWGIFRKIQENKGMLLRTLYVLIGVTSIVIIYFVIRAWRLRRHRNKSRKYGLITSRGTDMEMAPLDDPDDDDDDDMTVYEQHKLRK